MDHFDFIKLEATGNDYVFLDALESPQLPELSPQEIAALSDRRYGAGGDGVVVIAPSDQAEAHMLMWNADGSRSSMCGNALRSIALHLFQRRGLREFLLESDVGLHQARIVEVSGPDTAQVEIEMGAPRFAPEEIPLRADLLEPDPAGVDSDLGGQAGSPGELPVLAGSVAAFQQGAAAALDRLELRHSASAFRAPAVALSMGNPHLALFVDDADRAPFERLGPTLERHPIFPERANIEFVSPRRDGVDGLYQRTFERGSGETLSCGSGACAVHVAAVLTGRAGPVGKIRVRGGELELEWRGAPEDLPAEELRRRSLTPEELQQASVWLRGPARRVFAGRVARSVLAGGRPNSR